MTNSAKSWFFLILLSIIWGSSFILMKKAMFTGSGETIFTDVQVGALRMSIAAIALLPFAFKSLRKIESLREVILLIIVGLSGNFFPAFLFTFAETGISSGYAGMLNSCTPIFALVIGFLIFKERLSSTQLIGVLIGTTGVVLLMIAGHDLSITGGLEHIAAIIVATLCYAISINTMKYTLQKFKSFEIASLSFLFILIPSLIISYQYDAFTAIQEHKHAYEGLIYLGILSIVGTAFALIIFNRLVAMAAVLFTTSVTYLIPIVAVLFGFYFNEKINAYQIGSMLIVLCGVYIGNRKKSSKTEISKK